MARPTYVSRVPRGLDVSVPMLGSRMLGLPLLPQGLVVARVLEDRSRDGVRFPEVVVQMPRRATKTTAIWAALVGRAATRAGYRAVVTAQSGTTASRILLDHAQLLLAAGSAVESRERSRPEAEGKVVVYRNGGRERLEFPNGSRITVVPPDAGAVRSAAADDIVIDEAGEHDPVKGRDFLDAVQPLMDTCGPLAQLIVTGTPGRVRSGPFWDYLAEGRTRKNRHLGIVDYSIRDDEDAADRKVWRRVHPGPSSKLTPMSVLERRWERLGPVPFAREYLCRWPFDSSTTAIDSAVWAAREVGAVTLPERFAVGFDCEPSGEAAAVVAAWRDGSGRPVVALLGYRPGTGWVAGDVAAVVRKHRGTSVAADGIGANVPVLEQLGRARPMVVASTARFKEIQGACQTFVADLPTHQAHPALEQAVAGACWRQVDGGRLFGRKASSADVSPLVAAVIALWRYDTTPARRAPVIATASGGGR